MRLAALAVLLVVACVHYGVNPLARFYPEPAQAGRALFYVAQGLKGVILFALIASIAPRRLTAIPLYLACLWGVAEDSMVAGCRIARGIANTPSIPLWRGVCESEFFYFVGPVIGAIAAGALLWEFDDANRNKGGSGWAQS